MVPSGAGGRRAAAGTAGGGGLWGAGLAAVTVSGVAGALRGRRGGAGAERGVGARISAAALAIGAFTVGVKLVSLGSTLVVASLFGTGDDLEAFLIAFLVPSTAMSVICGAFGSALIPTYVQVREQHGEAHAQALFSRIMFLAVGLLGLVSVGFAVVLPYLLPLLASGFAPAKLALATRLSYFLLPVIVVKGVATIYGAVLNAEERFSLVAAAPALIPASTIACMLLWPVAATRIYALAAGTVRRNGGRADRRELVAQGARHHVAAAACRE